MQAFVDDSGGKGQTSAFVLAGAFGPSEKWAEFSDEWQGVLDIDPPLAYFKAREAAGLTGQFRRWGPEARDERLALLVRTIDRYGFRRIEVSIDLQAHEELMAVFGIYPWRDAYFLVFQEIIMGVCRDLLSQGQQERFEIFFDEQRILGPRAQSWYPLFKNEMTPEEQAIMPVQPVFRSDDEFLPLQASDLFAWLCRNRISNLSDPLGWVIAKFENTPLSLESFSFTRETLVRIVEISEVYMHGTLSVSPASAREYLNKFELRPRRDYRQRNPQ